LRAALEAIKPARKEKAKSRSNRGRQRTDEIDEAGLQPDLLNLIINGVSNEEDRSRKFMSAVAKLKRLNFALDPIVKLFEKYPDGIAKKYEGRIRQETERVYNTDPDCR
jgi:hypothetical protein